MADTGHEGLSIVAGKAVTPSSVSSAIGGSGRQGIVA
jgi:hypothetical protein